MKNLIFVAFFALLQSVASSAWAGANQWTNIGLTGMDVGPLSISPTTPPKLYTYSSSGLYMNAMDGGGWTQAQYGRSRLWAWRLVIDPSNPATLYAADSSNIYKSVDAGLSWNPLPLSISTIGNLDALSISPSNPNIFYASFTKMGGDNNPFSVWKSLDSGVTWNKTAGANLYPSYSLWNFIIDPFNPATLYTSALQLNTSGGSSLYQSLDGGESWTAKFGTGLPAGAAIGPLTIAPTKPATLYAIVSVYSSSSFGGATYEQVSKSTNGGVSWTAANRGLPSSGVFQSLTVDPTNPATLYAVTYHYTGANKRYEIYRSTDGGGNWSVLSSTGLPTWETKASTVTIGSLAVDPINPSVLYAATINGVYTFTAMDSQANAPAECVMNWVESKYAGLFAPVGSLSTTAGGYIFRSYAASRAYLGVSATNNHLVYQGADGVLQDGGPLKDWVTKSSCQTVANLPSSDCLFNWAEANYPGQFAPAGSPTEVSAAFTARNYAATKAKLAVSAANNHLYYQGADGSLLDEGPLAQWLPLARCQ